MFKVPRIARTRPSLRLDAAFVVDGLTVRRGGRLVLESISFAVRAGGALLVVGRNGAGKSTLLRALAGLLPRAGGDVRVQPGSGDASVAEQVHYLGHAEGLKSSLSAVQNLCVAAAVLGASRAGAGLAPETALDRLGIGHLADLAVGYLSSGQRRRVALARLLVARRAIWLLDEPSTALDAAAQATLADLMNEHRATGGIVVAATHAPLGLDGALELSLEP